MHDDLLVVISHYASRDTSQLKKLLIDLHPLVKNIVIVVNSNDVTNEFQGIFEGYPAIFRPNVGMNIGGWSIAYQNFPSYAYYIFLQDECSLLDKDFVLAYKNELNRYDVGMTGESINYRWDKTWQEIFGSPINYPTDIFLTNRQVSRVEYYLNSMSEWGVQPGNGGRHLRALVWGFNNLALSKLKAFPIGINKEQCIASEIAVSKAIEQIGLKVTQVSESPFSYFMHSEWRKDGISKI